MPPSVLNGKVDSELSAVDGKKDLSHSDRLEGRAADIVDRLAGLAAFSKATGASRELEVSRSDVDYQCRLWNCVIFFNLVELP